MTGSSLWGWALQRKEVQGRRKASLSSQYISFASMGLLQFSARHTSQTHLPEGRGVSEAVFPVEVEFDYTTCTSSQA